MCGLILDAAVIIGLVHLLNDGDSPNLLTAIASALAIGLASMFGVWFLDSLGTLAVLLGLFPLIAAAAGLVLWVACDVPPKRAAIGGGVFLVYKIGIWLILVAIFAAAAG